MKKPFLLLLLPLCFLFCLFGGCKEENSLSEYVSELRQNIYTGESTTYKVKAYYGYSEHPLNNDGVKGSPIYKLTFMLKGLETENTTYTLIFDYEEQNYKQAFAFNPVKNLLLASVEVEDFTLKTFDISIEAGGNTEKVKLTSIVPENALTYTQALTKLTEQQPDLIKSYYNSDGVFTAEIFARIIVKNDKPYWYIGFANGNGNLKALLVDGVNGNVLAIRDVF